MCKHLEGLFEEIVSAADSDGVRAALRIRSADLIVLHVSSALEGGGELLTWIRRLDSPPTILAVGSHDMAELTEKLQELGVLAYLPVWRVAEDLFATVERNRGSLETQAGCPPDKTCFERGRMEAGETTSAEDDRRQDRCNCISQSARAGNGDIR